MFKDFVNRLLHTKYPAELPVTECPAHSVGLTFRGRLPAFLTCIHITIILAMLCSNRCASAQDILAQAVSGSPFGYAEISIPLEAADAETLQLNSFSLSDAEGRTFYPVFSGGTLRRLIAEVLPVDDKADAKNISVYFLFTGDTPLTVKVYTSKVHVVRVVPQKGRPLQKLLMQQTWWREYSALERMQAKAGDYPPLVEAYLSNMLSARLGLQPPLLARLNEEKQNEVFEFARVLAGAEHDHLVAMRDLFHAPPESDATATGLPAEIHWPPAPQLPIDPQLQIEEISQRVPRECFYVRFGSWQNQVWLSYLMREYGGDLSRMIMLRGLDSQDSDRFELQLSLFKNKFVDMFGGQAISDLAFIGRDFYMREGSAMGVVIQAKTDLLPGQLMNERRRVQKEYADRGATMENIQVAGHEVSFLSTPDNSIRSYFASDGRYHIVSNSLHLVERFYEVPTDGSALANANHFQHIRQQMPLSREDTIFTYMSPEFFQGLLSMHYQIETRRRVRASAKIEMLQLARLAAKHETGNDLSIDQLMAQGFLPRRFAMRHDGVPEFQNGKWYDLQRGGRRTFLPITDVPVITATRGEVEFYNQQSQYIRERIDRIDPIAIGMRRFDLNGKNLERLVVDVKMAPMEPEKYGWLVSLLGPPMEMQVQPLPNEIISIRASLDGGLVFENVPPHQWFIGIQDEVPEMNRIRRAGFFEVLDIARNTPGYLGAWPKPGLIDYFPIMLSRDVDRDGFSRSMIGLWRMQTNDFSVLSFDKQRLQQLKPELNVVRSTVPAQISFKVGDLSESNLKSWVTTLTYQRSLQTSQGNPRLLHTISQQLGVPADQSRAVAEDLLDARLSCALAGEYELQSLASGLPYWMSDKLPDEKQVTVPDTYEAQFLKWFRGCQGHLLMDNGQLNAQVFLDIQRSSSEPKITLPSFNLFGK
jgi:hypothetical protein